MDFHLQLIEVITNNFSEELKVGGGEHGDVYKGVLHDGEDIALKKMHPLQGLDDKQLVNEIRDLIKVSHKNIVRLIGYCYESRHKIFDYKGELVLCTVMVRVLCFEYMHGGSLDKHIADDEPCRLDWPTCYEIIRGTCEGLNHLHTMPGKPLFHLDLKPANILLDKNLKPKISDLGLSVLVSSTQAHSIEILKGTQGYIPPEYRSSRLVSNKFDVFSLGIIIIKVMAGNIGYFRCSEMSPKDLIEFVSENWTKRLQAMPGYYSSHEIDILRVITCIEIALRCVETDQEKRPCIENIVHELEELETEIKRIMLLPPDRRRELLLTNQGPGMEFPKITRLCMGHDLAQYKRILDFKFSLIEDITDGFSDDKKIRSDGYGDVYSAVYNGEEIVVKKLHSFEVLDDKEFDNEMHILSKVRHKNVGRLIGYCCYETCLINVEHSEECVSVRKMERVLCFEYMHSGSLDKHIADEPCGLDWSTLYKIIKGTCEGLNYLLSAQQKPILHLDLTPANIFLVKGKTPKIIGFGLWRLIDSTKMHQTKIFKETHGYMPPEYVDIGFISNKFDVFSLGVIIIKLMAGKMGYSCCFEMSPKEFIQHTGSIPHYMSLQHLRDITNNFSDGQILGRGGFYVVYKGVLQSGEIIAVKKLQQPTLSSQAEFEKEVKLLIELKHPNIVQLVGYCYETQNLHILYEGEYAFAEDTHTLLCLECLPNGSLDKYISAASSGLDWRTRCKIIEGISYGLQYLHEQSKGPILHLDLKPANILLDEDMLPKITDFGLSRFLDQSQTIHTAIPRGTPGYMPPEFFRGTITPMTDIFGLGVIILEVITGHRDYPYNIRTCSQDFIERELQEWRNVLEKEARFESLETECQQIKRFIQIGLICVNPERTKRPIMKKIIDMLHGLESMDWYISNELSSDDSRAEL